MRLFKKREPKTFKARYRAGLRALRKKDFEAAVQHLNEVLDERPDYVPALHNLGVTFHLNGQHSKAIEKFERVIELKPGEVRAYLNLAAAENSLGHLDAAEQALLKGLAIDPQQPGVHYNLAVIYLKRRKTAKAMSEMELELAVNPHHRETEEALRALRERMLS